MSKISKLHFITQYVNDADHAALAKEACEGGVDWVQLRIKNVPDEELKNEALKVQEICKDHKATFIINDHVELAKEIKADGVHLGKKDMDTVTARLLLGDDFIIGGTANTLEDILKLGEANIDYIGLGPFRFTTTKENLSPMLGLEGYEKIISECRARNIKIPIIAIGGIQPGDVQDILKTGVYGIAVSSFINKSKNRVNATKTILNVVESFS